MNDLFYMSVGTYILTVTSVGTSVFALHGSIVVMNDLFYLSAGTYTYYRGIRPDLPNALCLPGHQPLTLQHTSMARHASKKKKKKKKKNHRQIPRVHVTPFVVYSLRVTRLTKTALYLISSRYAKGTQIRPYNRKRKENHWT
jgi:hypothetical protein